VCRWGDWESVKIDGRWKIEMMTREVRKKMEWNGLE
jgi:hypothetical protein